MTGTKATRHDGELPRGTFGIVLAAGASRRFGPDNKLLANFQGRPLASHAADAMRAAPLERCFAVVSDPDVGALFDGYELVAAPEGCAQSESLRLGVGQAIRAGAERVVVALADMPFVTTELIGLVAARSGAFGASASIDDGRRSPPAAFSRSHFDALLSATGDSGGIGIVRELPAEALIDAPGLLADIDTVSDLEALERGDPPK